MTHAHSARLHEFGNGKVCGWRIHRHMHIHSTGLRPLTNRVLRFFHRGNFGQRRQSHGSIIRGPLDHDGARTLHLWSTTRDNFNFWRHGLQCRDHWRRMRVTRRLKCCEQHGGFRGGMIFRIFDGVHNQTIPDSSFQVPFASLHGTHNA